MRVLRCLTHRFDWWTGRFWKMSRYSGVNIWRETVGGVNNSMSRHQGDLIGTRGRSSRRGGEQKDIYKGMWGHRSWWRERGLSGWLIYVFFCSQRNVCNWARFLLNLNIDALLHKLHSKLISVLMSSRSWINYQLLHCTSDKMALAVESCAASTAFFFCFFFNKNSL